MYSRRHTRAQRVEHTALALGRGHGRRQACGDRPILPAGVRRIRSCRRVGPPDGSEPPAVSTDPGAQRIFNASVHLAENLHRVPVYVIPCYLEEPQVNGGNIALTTMYGSILQAVWSFQLALRSRGLGSVWTTLHLFHEKPIAELLRIPAGVTQVALIPVAYTLGGDFKPPPRRPWEEVTFWNEWDVGKS